MVEENFDDSAKLSFLNDPDRVKRLWYAGEPGSLVFGQETERAGFSAKVTNVHTPCVGSVGNDKEACHPTARILLPMDTVVFQKPSVPTNPHLHLRCVDPYPVRVRCRWQWWRRDQLEVTSEAMHALGL